jgi:HAMP domain-containing protein
VGFAVGIAVLLVGVILGWLIVAIGAAIAAIFGFLWIREVTRPVRATEPVAAPEPAARPEGGARAR